MNQILMVDNKKKKKSKSSQIEIANIVRFFAFILIVFGLSFIGQGSYAIYQDSIGRNTENIPSVTIKRVNDTIILTAKSDTIIEKLRYTWGNAQETIIPANTILIQEEIILPVQNSILNVVVEETTGRAVKYQKEIVVEGIDMTKPEIEISQDSIETGSIKITATDELAISHITYKVNDEEEITIEKSNIEDKTINYVLRLQRGENKVVISAVDKYGNTGTIEKKIIVSGRTSINLVLRNGKIIVKVEDPDGVRDIEVKLNGEIHTKKDINEKQTQMELDVKEGTNTIKITVTNINSLVTTGTKEFNYER